MTKYKGIKISNKRELNNWNPKLLHFYLEFPSYFPDKFLEMIDFCEKNDINVKLEEKDKQIIAKWRVIKDEIRKKRDSTKTNYTI